MKKKLSILLLCLSTIMMFGCGKSGKKDTSTNTGDSTDIEATTENKDVLEAQKGNDIASAKTIKTAVETALGNENIYDEMTTTQAGKLIIVTDTGLDVLDASTKSEILNNIGRIPEVKYKAIGADHFAFSVDAKGEITVYVCDANNSTKWMLAPDVDMEYGGTVNTELIGVDETGATAETDVELETVMKQNDITSAKCIKVAFDTALGNENTYDELSSDFVDKKIAVTDEGLNVLQQATKEEIVNKLGTLPTVYYTKNGADHFVVILNDKMKVQVFVCNADESKLWALTPKVDAEYTTDASGSQTGADEQVNSEEAAELKANDLTTAKSIRTAIENALMSEYGWDDFTYKYYNRIIVLEESELAILDDSTSSNIINDLGGSLPIPAYKSNGADRFAVSVDGDGNITVYTTNTTTGDTWTLLPDLDPSYN